MDSWSTSGRISSNPFLRCSSPPAARLRCSGAQSHSIRFRSSRNAGGLLVSVPGPGCFGSVRPALQASVGGPRKGLFRSGYRRFPFMSSRRRSFCYFGAWPAPPSGAPAPVPTFTRPRNSPIRAGPIP